MADCSRLEIVRVRHIRQAMPLTKDPHKEDNPTGGPCDKLRPVFGEDE